MEVDDRKIIDCVQNLTKKGKVHMITGLDVVRKALLFVAIFALPTTLLGKYWIGLVLVGGGLIVLAITIVVGGLAILGVLDAVFGSPLQVHEKGKRVPTPDDYRRQTKTAGACTITAIIATVIAIALHKVLWVPLTNLEREPTSPPLLGEFFGFAEVVANWAEPAVSFVCWGIGGLILIYLVLRIFEKNPPAA